MDWFFAYLRWPAKVSRPSSCNQGSTGFPRKVINPAASKQKSEAESEQWVSSEQWAVSSEQWAVKVSSEQQKVKSEQIPSYSISRGRSSTSANDVSKATSSLPRDPLQCPGRTIIILFSVEIFAKKQSRRGAKHKSISIINQNQSRDWGPRNIIEIFQIIVQIQFRAL